ncbi:hypothetical protein [Microlunatus soli]|uniref:Uncharacterized protein n=1 Tax=Microlunatus soli TaxID=630515 RepID=A0A1H1VL70_9ACTN|nr:hypothetical protein [Microlunatus soli]SDS85425.1 hypothetical protein SAMN04489812_3257 [Microlunatus soli]
MSSRSAEGRVGGPAAPTWVLCVAAILAPLSAPVLDDEPSWPFWATLIVHLLAAGLLLTRAVSWLRSGARARRRDVVLAVAPAVAGLLALGLVMLGADEYGIRGSAVPRLTQGIRSLFLTDLGYVGSVLAIIIVLASSVTLVAVLARRRLRAGWDELSDGVADVATAAATAAVRTRNPRGFEPKTRPSDGFWRRLLSPSTRIVMIVNVLVAMPILWVLAADPDGDLVVLGFLFIFPGLPITAWAVLQTLWRPDSELGYIFAALARTMIVPAVTSLPFAVLQTVLTRLPVFVDRVEQHSFHGSYIRHYWFSGESGAINVVDGSVIKTLLISMLGGYALSLLAGLVITVFVIWPAIAFLRPRALLREAQLSQRPSDLAASIASVRAQSVIAILALAIPSLMVPTDSDEVLWWIGVALIPVGVVLVYVAWRGQQIARKALAAGSTAHRDNSVTDVPEEPSAGDGG